MKKLILIIGLLISISGFCQHGNFMFNQHERDECEYGNLDDYTFVNFNNAFHFNECDPVLIVSLADAKIALDRYRSAACSVKIISGTFGGMIDVVLNNYILRYDTNDAKCELNGIDNGWYIYDDDYSLGNTKIVYFDNSIITSIEYY